MRDFPVRHLALWVLLTSLLLAGVSAPPATEARGPNLPLRFLEDPDEASDAWTLHLRIEPKEVAGVTVERHLYFGGARVKTERLPVTPRGATDGRDAAEVQVPLRFAGIESLQPGAYAQKIVAQARWEPRHGGARPLVVQRWIAFVVDKGGVRRVSLEEYSRIADPSELSHDARGREVLVGRGGDVKADVPLDKTQRTPAVSVGRGGGLAQETPDAAPSDPRRGAPDRSEADEK